MSSMQSLPDIVLGLCVGLAVGFAMMISAGRGAQEQSEAAIHRSLESGGYQLIGRDGEPVAPTVLFTRAREEAEAQSAGRRKLFTGIVVVTSLLGVLGGFTLLR